MKMKPLTALTVERPFKFTALKKGTGKKKLKYEQKSLEKEQKNLESAWKTNASDFPAVEQSSDYSSE